MTAGAWLRVPAPLTPSLPRSGALLPSLQCLCGLAAIALMIVPFGTFGELNPETVVFSTAAALAVLAFSAHRIVKRQGVNPWTTAPFLLMAFVAARYGGGAITVFLWDRLPWQVEGIARKFFVFGARGNIENTCHLLLLGAAAFFIGSTLPAGWVAWIGSGLTWKVDQRRLKGNLLLFTPVALFVLLVGRYSASYAIALLGTATQLLVLLASYWLFSATARGERTAWAAYLAIVICFASAAGLVTGSVGEFLFPIVALAVGYLLARGRAPWLAIAIAFPLFFFGLFPWLTIYKYAKKEGAQLTVDERIARFQEMREIMPYPIALEFTAERFFARMALAELTAIFSRHYPDNYEFEHGRSFEVEAIAAIPRLLWPNKPFVDGEFNQFSVNVGLMKQGAEQSAVFDAISEYYINFGLPGVFFLCLLHGYYLAALREWLVARMQLVLGAAMFMQTTMLNMDLFGLGIVLLTHSRVLLIWIPLFYFMSKSARVGVAPLMPMTRSHS